MKFDTYVSSITKLKSKWIKEHNIRADVLNQIKGTVGLNSLVHERTFSTGS